MAAPGRVCVCVDALGLCCRGLGLGSQRVGTMSSCEPVSSSSAGPTIEWLEPQLPELLNNGGGLAGFPPGGQVDLEGSRLDLTSTESCSFSGVRLGAGGDTGPAAGRQPL